MTVELPDPPAPLVSVMELAGPDANVRSRQTPKRLSVGLFVIGLGWVFANSVLALVILAAKLAILSPDNKVQVFGALSASTAVLTTVVLFLWGAISDLTRTRFGRRTPMIAIGAVGGAIGLVLLATSSTLPTFIAAYLFYSIVFSALPPAVLAIFPDRVPTHLRGTVSAVYGASQLFASALATIVASRFITNPSPVLFLSAGVLIVSSFAFLLIAPDYSNKDQPRGRLDMRGLLQAFKFPAGAPDFYWAFAGRFLLFLGLFMVMNFTLYILTDFMGLDSKAAADTIALIGLAQLVTMTLSSLVAGPISDRLGRRKLPIFVSSVLFVVAALIPFVFRSGTSMVAFAAVAGLGMGAFLSVDAALMTEVLPNPETRGKDLGLLNTANTVPQILSPLITTGIVSLAGYSPVFLVSVAIMTLGAFSIFKIRSVR